MVSFTKLNVKWIVALCVIVFTVLTLLFSDYGGISDGLTRIGFPLVFMQETGGKCIDCRSIKWFNTFYLFVDLLLSLIIAFFLVKVSTRIR
ncbi:hypothetical protein D3C87_167260 [compost metagenome]